MNGDRQLAQEHGGYTSNDTAIAFKAIDVNGNNFLSAGGRAVAFDLKRGHDGIVRSGVMRTLREALYDVPVDLGWLALDKGGRHAKVGKESSQLEGSYEVRRGPREDVSPSINIFSSSEELVTHIFY